MSRLPSSALRSSRRCIANNRLLLARRCGAMSTTPTATATATAMALTVALNGTLADMFTTMLAVTFGAVLLAGCAETSPQWDRHFGDAIRVALAQQIIAPAAARNADPVSGVDGRAAAQAQLRYQKSLADPAPASGIVAGAGAAQ